jgi:multiple sugar transport system ATP-binding protein
VPGAADGDVWVGVRPEGFLLQEDGPLSCKLNGVEVMGRDISIVSTSTAAVAPVIRSIISAENKVDVTAGSVRFALKPGKVFLFHKQTEERIPFGSDRA